MPRYTHDRRLTALMILGLSVGFLLSTQAPAFTQQDDGGFRTRASGNPNRGRNNNSPNTTGTNNPQDDGDPNGFRVPSNYGAPAGGRSGGAHPTSLSECTALLEAAVRSLYKNIEPGDDPSPNELVAYADLRALRLYTGALEVAGWDLEKAATAMNDPNSGNSNDNGNGNGNNDNDNGNTYRPRPGVAVSSQSQSPSGRDKYLAFREAVRTLLFRVRTTAVAVEHQVSFCDPQVARIWQQEVVPALQDTIAATNPLFIEQTVYQNYRVPGQAVTNVVPVSSSGIPENAVEVAKNSVYQPYEGKGRGQGRYFEIRAFGGPVKVKTIRYRSHENSFGVIGTSVVRELTVDQVASPNEPVFVPCNRERYVDLSDLEVEWESVDSRRRTYAAVDVLGELPQQKQRSANDQ